MPKRSTQFQRLIALIHAALHESGTLCESAMMIDKITGVEREVDVLISKEVSGYTINIAIEVNEHARKADTTWVERMCKKHEALATDKLILVSRSGFYRPAIKKAEHYGAETVTWQQAVQTDWGLAVRMTSRGFLRLTTTSYSTSAQLRHSDGRISEIPIPVHTTVFLPYRETPTDVEQMVLFFLDEPTVKNAIDARLNAGSKNQEFKLEYKTQPGMFVLDERRENAELIRLWVELRVDSNQTPIEFAVARYKDRELAYGSSADPMNKLIYVLVHDGAGDRGMLLDERGLRKLTVTSG